MPRWSSTTRHGSVQTRYRASGGILTEIANLKAPGTLPSNLLQQKHIDALTKLVRARFLENGPFAKQYLQLLVDEIRVNRQEVKLTGSYGAVAQLWREIWAPRVECPDSPLNGSPSWARTSDLRINSPSLYRLSYRGSN